MDNLTKEITREEFEKLRAMSYSEQEKYLLPNGIPEAWAYGYGYYGHEVYQRNGKYYRRFKIGSSCD